jgi:hypothetical protein
VTNIHFLSVNASQTLLSWKILQNWSIHAQYHDSFLNMFQVGELRPQLENLSPGKPSPV